MSIEFNDSIDLSPICATAPGVPVDAPCRAVLDMFATDKRLPAVAVLAGEDMPVGVAHRQAFALALATDRALFDDKPVSKLMDNAPILIERKIELTTLTTGAIERIQSAGAANVIVVDRGRFFGVAACSSLLQVLSDHLRHQSLEAEAARREAKHLAEGQTRYIANMTHELRTPLNGVIGFGQLLESETHGPLGAPEYKLYARDIVDSGQHLIAIINDILDLAKLESGRVELHERFVDLRELTGRSIRMVATLAADKRIKLRGPAARQHWTVRADERRLQQALVNLLSNAIKFTPADGEVGLDFGMNAGWVWIEVWDRGCGIAEADLKRLFKPYEQVNNALNGAMKGTGLGLTITRALMHAHGGDVDLKSDVGKGTTATLMLPRSRLLADEFAWSVDGKVEFIDPPDDDYAL